MGSEDLDQGNLECRDLAVQEDPRQVKLDLETNINVCSIYCGWSRSANAMKIGGMNSRDHHKVKRRLGIWFNPER